MTPIKIAKIIYYLLVFCWLAQIMMTGYTRELILPTIVLIVYGLWLNHKMRKNRP